MKIIKTVILWINQNKYNLVGTSIVTLALIAFLKSGMH